MGKVCVKVKQSDDTAVRHLLAKQGHKHLYYICYQHISHIQRTSQAQFTIIISSILYLDKIQMNFRHVHLHLATYRFGWLGIELVFPR